MTTMIKQKIGFVALFVVSTFLLNAQNSIHPMLCCNIESSKVVNLVGDLYLATYDVLGSDLERLEIESVDSSVNEDSLTIEFSIKLGGQHAENAPVYWCVKDSLSVDIKGNTFNGYRTIYELSQLNDLPRFRINVVKGTPVYILVQTGSCTYRVFIIDQCCD